MVKHPSTSDTRIHPATDFRIDVVTRNGLNYPVFVLNCNRFEYCWGFGTEKQARQFAYGHYAQMVSGMVEYLEEMGYNAL